MTSRGREVFRRDVADDLVDRVDAVLAEPARVVADDCFARRLVHAERADLAVVVDDDMAVLPRDLGELALDDLARTAAHGGHLGLSDVEAPDDHVARHARDDSGTMDSAELKAAQAPLKARYRDDPAAALVTLRAEGTLGDESVSCSVSTGRALVEAGLHPATGGTGLLACSGDMLLEALVACAGVTLRAVATSLGLDVRGTVHAEGDLDFRGTLGVGKDEGVPVGFTAIRLRFELEHDEDEAAVAKLLELTERYCVVFQTLTGGVPVDSRASYQGATAMPPHSVGVDVADGLRELPAVAGEILDDARALAVDVRLRLLEHARARVACARECGVYVGDAKLDQLRDDSARRRDLRVAHVGDHERPVVPGAHLRAVVVADAHALAEPERRLEERDCGANVRIDQDGGDGGGRGGAIRLHQPKKVFATSYHSSGTVFSSAVASASGTAITASPRSAAICP